MISGLILSLLAGGGSGLLLGLIGAPPEAALIAKTSIKMAKFTSRLQPKMSPEELHEFEQHLSDAQKASLENWW